MTETADTPPKSRLVTRRGVLTGATGAAVGAAAVGAWWLTQDQPIVVTTALPRADRLTHSMLWTTLGTMSGPIGSPTRAQPANLLHNGDQAILVDVGDGAVDQLVKAGVSLTSVGTVLISHLHMDHTAGLMGLIGRRVQTLATDPLTIYGPPGTKQEVDRLQVALQYMMDLTVAMAPSNVKPTFGITVREINDGAAFTVGAVTITAATNSHYSFEAGSAEAKKFVSLSYRFDLGDRSIAYTGDTGPSANVEQLARGVDLLVAEICDPDVAVEQIRVARPDLPAYVGPIVKKHFEREHLGPEQAGQLARAAGAKSLVLTHNPLNSAQIAAITPRIIAEYDGPLSFADDLDNW